MNKILPLTSIFLAALLMLMPFSAAAAGPTAQVDPAAGLWLPALGSGSGEPYLDPQSPGVAHLVYLPRLVTPPYKINPAPGTYSPAEITLEVHYAGIPCFYARVAPVGDWPNLRAPYEDIGGNCAGDQVTIWLDVAAEITFDQIRIDFYDEFARQVASRILYVGQYTFHY